MHIISLNSTPNMDRGSKQQYMQTLREKYLKADKKEKGVILDEYCRNTGMDRIYVSRRFNYKARLKDARIPRKARKEIYDGLVKAALVVIWKIFDYPCGARLTSILKTETEHMRALKELTCSELPCLRICRRNRHCIFSLTTLQEK